MALRIIEVVLPEREADTLPEFVDEVQRRYCNVSGFHLLILPVTAALPRAPEAEDGSPDETPRTFGSKGGGLTREELYTEGMDLARPSKVFYATVILSTIVVAIGLLRDNTAVIIGAMVIAPLLGPNVSLALPWPPAARARWS